VVDGYYDVQLLVLCDEGLEGFLVLQLELQHVVDGAGALPAVYLKRLPENAPVNRIQQGLPHKGTLPNPRLPNHKQLNPIPTQQIPPNKQIQHPFHPNRFPIIQILKIPPILIIPPCNCHPITIKLRLWGTLKQMQFLTLGRFFKGYVLFYLLE
jgi:hypothetical protein